MQYRQDSLLKSNELKRTAQSGEKIKQIVFEKQITQQWKVHTNEPTQLLPYAIKHMGLSIMCEFWHQLKFLYFENYQEIKNTQETNQDTLKQTDQEQYEEESIILIRHSSQRIQQCKRFIKSLWKITRQRLIISLNKIKLEAGLQDDSSLQLQDEKLNSYMRFLKLQENKRIDIAIENLDSVVQKNSRKKVLNAFLNMRQILKQQRKAQNYGDKIKIECFIDIVMRSVRRMNQCSLSEAFSKWHQFTEHVKVERQVSKVSGLRRGDEQQKVSRSKKQNLSPKPDINKKSNYKSSMNVNTNQKSVRKTIINQRSSIGSNKLLTPQLGQHKKDTVQRGKMMMSRQDNCGNKKQMSLMSTVKRKQPIQRPFVDEDNLMNSNIQSIESQLQLIQSNQKVIQSHYYYEDSYKNEQQEEEEQLLQQYNNANINGLPTRRISNHSSHYNMQNNFKPIEQVNSQIIHKKTARTPNRSHSRLNSHQNNLNQNSYLSQQLLNNNYINTKTNSQHQHQINQTNSQNSSIKNLELHIPITQRFEKNYYHQEHYQEEQQQQSDAPSTNNIHQQICVIRNFSTTPQRTPDRYEKIPIVSNNIEFRQFFVNSTKKKSSQHHVDLHSNSFYQRQCTQDCQYCTRLRKVNQMVQQLSARKNKIQRQTNQINRKTVNVVQQSQSANNKKEITTIEEKITYQTQLIEKSQTISNNQTQIIDKKQQPNLKLKNNLQIERPSNANDIKEPSKLPDGQQTIKLHEKDEKSAKNIQVKKQYKVGQNSRTMLQPSRQSVFSEKSKGPPKGKMFTRKPMY